MALSKFLSIITLALTVCACGFITCETINTPQESKWRHCDCEWSVTETNKGRARRGELIFEDNFDFFNLDTWEHEITGGGGGNSEFQIYHNNRSNSYVRQGILYIKPTLTSDKHGEDFLTKGTLKLHGTSPANSCTGAQFDGCFKRGSPTNIINPIMSARIRTYNSFSFKYGVVKIRAKLPVGDWLWPAIWFLPKRQQYGGWIASGEIDLMESRGNLNLTNSENKNIGVEQFSSAVHFGPYYPLDGYEKARASFKKSSPPNHGFNQDFHVYGLEWTPDYIKFSIDDEVTGTISPPNGFWELGGFPNGTDNPWKYGENPKMAPFDHKFYLIMNLAVGGTSGYWPDNLPGVNKPWKIRSENAALDFWNARSEWLPTWDGENAALQIDYVRVWAL